MIIGLINNTYLIGDGKVKNLVHLASTPNCLSFAIHLMNQPPRGSYLLLLFAWSSLISAAGPPVLNAYVGGWQELLIATNCNGS